MGKYDKLATYFSNINQNKVRLSFGEIENILCFKLPNSARKYRPWWANDKTHIQSISGWLGVNWKVSFVNMNSEIIEFSREGKRITNIAAIINKNELSPNDFEKLMKMVMSKYYKKQLFTGEIVGIPKLFDMVSEDKSIVGDAKYLSMVRGQYIPPAKFSVIAEHVWLLEKTNSVKRFLVFGNDRRVPVEWLKRYSNLVNDVKFFFYDINKSEIEKLN